jgi:hypothetical protein
MAAGSTFWKNNIMGSMRIRSGNTPPVELLMDTDKGDLGITGLSRKLNELVKMERRGRLGSLAYGNRIYPGISFTAFVGNFIGSDAVQPGTPFEMLMGLGAYSTNFSTFGNVAPGLFRPYTTDIQFLIEGDDVSDVDDEIVTCEDVYVTADHSEDVAGNVLSFSGEILGRVIFANAANELILAQIGS